MRKFYSLLSVFLFCMVAFSANATKITVNIDDVSRVAVKVNNVEQKEFSNGDNSLDVPEYASVSIEAKSGAFISKVVRKSTSAEEYVSNMTSCYLSISSSNEGETWTVTSINADDARDGKCRVYVDDASKVKIQRSGTYTYAELIDGWNDLSFIIEKELPLTVGSADYSTPLYAVKLNGEAVKAEGSAYRISPANGDKIEVFANYPDEAVAVSFSYVDEEAKGFISSVKVGDKEVTNYNDKNFTVKLGQKLTIAGNANSYKLNSLTVNDSPVNFYGSYSFTVTGETKIYVDARKYGMVNAVIDIDHPENVTVYEGYSYSNKLMTLKEGRNEVALVETNSLIQIMPQSGCTISSVSDGTNSYYADYSNAYTVTLTEGMVLTIKSQSISRDKTAMVYIDDRSAATQYFNFQRGDRSSIDLASGYNKVAFYDGDNPFGLSWYGAQFANVYKNGETVSPMYENTTTYELRLADGDVVKVYLASNPEKHHVSFKLNGVEAGNIAATCDRITKVADWADDFDVLSGTEVSLSQLSGSDLTVRVNDKVVEAGEDGKFTFVVDADTECKIAAGAAGVDSIGVEAVGSDVYNLHGILLIKDASKEQIDELPAGFYIIGGKKRAIL